MATKKDGNGHDPTERMVRILESIEREIHGFREETNERLGRLETQAKQTNVRLDNTNERLGRLETQAKQTNKRLSNVEKRLTGVEVRGMAVLEERFQQLEARVHDLEAAE